MMNSSIKIAITDQYALSAKSLGALLAKYSQVQLLGDVRSCEELLLFLEKNTIDVALINIIHSNLSKLSICKKINLQFPHTKLIALSSDFNKQTAKELKDYGLQAYLTRELEPATFIDEICKVVALASPDLILSETKTKTLYESLRKQYKISFREIEVVSLIGKGFTSSEMANQLSISHNTVKQHRKHILHKLQLKNAQQVVAFSIQNGL